MVQPADALPQVDASRPHPVRVYNYWLGGKDNYAVDRELGDAMIAELPDLAATARAHRRFMVRTVRHLAEAGIGQYLLLGSGLPSSYNLHQVAQEVDPAAAVVYADPDPMVAAHSRALLISHPKGSVTFVPGSVADPAALLADPALVAALDLDAPLAVTLASSLMRFSDSAAHEVLDVLRDRLAPGSYLSLSHPTADFDPPAVSRALRVGQQAGFQHSVRSTAEVEALFAGWDLVEPGVVAITGWHPDDLDERREAADVHVVGGLGRKP
jgi:O-methyltransferase involved in polyketide biosynthesis